MTIALYQTSGENKENVQDESMEEDVESDRESFHFDVPESLKVILERDNSFTSKNKRLLVLPANPNVVTILEGYIKNFAVNILCSSEEKVKHGAKQTFHPEKSIDLCKEIISDIRVMFDFILPTHLLYSNERAQYESIIQTYTPPQKIHDTPMPSPIKTEPAIHMTPENVSENKDEKVVELELPSPSKRRCTRRKHAPEDEAEEPSHDEEIQTPRRTTRSRKVEKTQNTRQSHDHKLPANVPPKQRNTRSQSKDEGRRQTRHSTVNEVKPESKKSTVKSTPQTPKRSSRSASHSNTNKAHDDKPVNSEPVTPVKEELPSPVINISPKRLRSTQVESPEADVAIPQLDSHAVTDIMRWKIIPNSLYYTEPPIPSIIYGAPHLLRLFARISEFITLMPMPDNKRCVLAKHIELFLAYLSERRDELFQDSFYEGHSDIRTRRH